MTIERRRLGSIYRITSSFTGPCTIAVDSVGIVLAAVGLLNPLLAAFIHVASEMTFILNSARLLPVERMHRWPAPIRRFVIVAEKGA